MAINSNLLATFFPGRKGAPPFPAPPDPRKVEVKRWLEEIERRREIVRLVNVDVWW